MVSGFKGGYKGKILRIDLSKVVVREEALSRSLAKNYIGGRGLNSMILYDEVEPGTDAFDPDNPLIFGVGPLNGTMSPSSSRWTVTAKSPLTGILGDSNAGSRFGPEMKYAGFDQIIIKGKAKKPVYIWVDDDGVEIKDAGHLWSKTTDMTTDVIRKELGDREVQIACIGPAGENLVKFACIMSDSRAAGRTGMGAVMGSKNLKAVAIRGSGDVEVADPTAFEEAVLGAYEKIRVDPIYPRLSTYGTPMLVGILNELGELSTKNAQTQFFEKANEISAETFLEKYAVKSIGCLGCVIHCSHYFAVNQGPFAGTHGEGVEYTTLFAFGSNCGNSNLPSILKAHVLSNQLGLDIQSTGDVIGFTMDCYDKEILTREEVDGLDLSWGNHQAVIELIERIAYRKSFGNTLAEGVKRAAEKIGKGSNELANHSKGLGYVGFETKKGYALGYATSTRGFDHLRGFHNIYLNESKALEIFGTSSVMDGRIIEGKPRLVKWHQELLAVVDSLETCKFNCVICYALGPEDLAKLFSAATGWPMNGKGLLRIGERIYNLERMFNVREGISRKDDALPHKMFKPVPSGPTKGVCPVTPDELNKMLDEYYELRGWNRNGIPTRAKITELNLPLDV